MTESTLTEKLTAFKYSLENEINKKYNIPVAVDISNNVSNDSKFPYIFRVQIRTAFNIEIYEVWKPVSGEQFYWERVQ